MNVFVGDNINFCKMLLTIDYLKTGKAKGKQTNVLASYCKYK